VVQSNAFHLLHMWDRSNTAVTQPTLRSRSQSEPGRSAKSTFRHAQSSLDTQHVRQGLLVTRRVNRHVDLWRQVSQVFEQRSIMVGVGHYHYKSPSIASLAFQERKIHPGQPLKSQTKITRVVDGSKGNHQPPALLPTPAFTALFFAAQLLLSNHPRARIWKSTTSPSSLSTLELTIALQVLCTNTAASTNRC
jgi:hypothetical protein